MRSAVARGGLTGAATQGRRGRVASGRSAGLVIPHEKKSLQQALLRLVQDEHLYSSLREGCAKAVTGLGWDLPIREMDALYSRLAG